MPKHKAVKSVRCWAIQHKYLFDIADTLFFSESSAMLALNKLPKNYYIVIEVDVVPVLPRKSRKVRKQ